MKERGIIFNEFEVRATLDGRKTQFRRPITKIVDKIHGGNITEFGVTETKGYDFHFRDRRATWNDVRVGWVLSRCPFGSIGDCLYLREGICTDIDGNIRYRFDYSGAGIVTFATPWKSSTQMPRWASRLTLEITGVRVERLQEITLKDIVFEGLSESVYEHKPAQAAFDAYRNYWDSMFSKKGHPWDANPWVWVVDFKVV